LPQLGRDIVETAKNIWVVDARSCVRAPSEAADGDGQSAVSEGESLPRTPEPDGSYLQATAELGWGIVYQALPIDHPLMSSASAQNLGPIWLSAEYVKCHRESSGEAGKDEPRFSMALCDGRTQSEYVSEEFSMGTGYLSNFRSNQLWSHVVQNGGLAVTVDAWEMDPGSGFEKAKIIIDEILKILMDELMPSTWHDLIKWTATELVGAGLPPQVLGLMAMVLTAIREFLNNNDDHVGTYAVMIPDPVFALQKEIQNAMRNPPAGGTAAKIASLTGHSQSTVSAGLNSGAYYCQRPVLAFDAGSDGKWEVGFITLPDSSNTVGSLPSRVRIDSAHSRKSLSIYDRSTSDNADICQFDWVSIDQQRWKFVALGGGNYKIESVGNYPKVITIAGPSAENDTRIVQWNWLDRIQQKWRLLPVAANEYFIVSNHSGGMLTIKGRSTSNDARIILFSMAALKAQVWTFTSV
jgi:hypothetical protein